MKKFLGNVKGTLAAALLLWLPAATLAAQGIVPSQLTSIGEQILEALTGDFAKIIISCSFGASCIAFAVNKDNEHAKQKIGAVMVATALLTATEFIVDAIMGSA
jgi:hypothetical protein